LFLFGPPEKVTAFVSSSRGQLPAEVDDDFLVHLHYPLSAPLPPDSEAPAPGTRISGPRITLGASCLAAHISSEQVRWRVEGTRGSFEKRGLDPQEDQLKAGWTPASHPDAFGSYHERIPASMRLGRLTTTMARDSSDTSANDAGSSGAPVQPKLVSSSIPMLPGRYIQFYQNVGQTIRDVEQARRTQEGIESTEKEEANEAEVTNLKATPEVLKALENLFVKPDQVIMTTRCILLARKSAAEQRTVAWTE
jgi:predicted dehydrogenase